MLNSGLSHVQVKYNSAEDRLFMICLTPERGLQSNVTTEIHSSLVTTVLVKFVLAAV